MKRPGVVDPVHLARGNVDLYRDKFPEWKGDALVGALSGKAFIRVDIDGDKARKADNWPMGARIRAVDQGPNGSVYLLEDGGRLLRLDPAAAR
jgi:glucose/arabinose dehydrogenase